MALRKIAKERREREAKMKKEVFFAGDENPALSKISEERDFYLSKIQFGLKDYCDLDETARSSRRPAYGGIIPDRVWKGEIETDTREIKMLIRQKYTQPGAKLIYVEAEIEYGPEIAKKDVDAVRNVLTLVGLEKRI